MIKFCVSFESLKLMWKVGAVPLQARSESVCRCTEREFCVYLSCAEVSLAYSISISFFVVVEIFCFFSLFPFFPSKEIEHSEVYMFCNFLTLAHDFSEKIKCWLAYLFLRYCNNSNT